MGVPSNVSLVWQSVCLPKRGHSAEEYEDAVAANPEAGRFAMADGASESSFAGLWARLLVRGFVRPSRRRGLAARWLRGLQQRWAADVDGRPLPWYAETKRQEGAFATLLGLVVRRGRGRGGAWQAVAVGDTCLFQVRNDTLLTSFPLRRAEDFNNGPAVLGSRGAFQGLQQQERHSGRWQVGDRLFLMTDALARWFLQQCEAEQAPWRTIEFVLTDPSPQEAFASWIAELRNRDGLRNDDVTLARVALFGLPMDRKPEPDDGRGPDLILADSRSADPNEDREEPRRGT